MGLSTAGLAFVAAMARAGLDFNRTLTLGRQSLFADARGIRAAFAEAGLAISPEDVRDVVGPFAEPLLKRLGAVDVESVDASDYEGATIVHDLNEPLPDRHQGAYTAVLDGGTLEHVFGLPVALKTALECVAVGGHYLAISPANGQAGHGFYQFSPELYYRVLSAQNGFRVRCMLWRAEVSRGRWYAAADPCEVQRRVGRRGRLPAFLFVAAARLDDRPVLRTPPQQSDYVAEWNTRNTTSRVSKGPPRSRSLARRSIAMLAPRRVKELGPYLGQAWEARTNRGDFDRVRLADVRLDR